MSNSGKQSGMDMNKKFLTVLSFLTLTCTSIQAENNTNTAINSGSGYEDMKGSVVNYGYENFDDFDLAVYNHKVKWLGQYNYFEGIAMEFSPVISKVADGIYFMSWGFGKGGDNVIHNYNTMHVNAHLDPADQTKNSLQNIHGKVYSINKPDTRFPHARLTALDAMEKQLEQNIVQKKLPPLSDKKLFNVQYDEDLVAKAELDGQTIKYSTPYGLTTIEINGDITRVGENNQDIQDYQTHATKIADGIYFLSWTDGNGGNHIIVNRNDMKVFDQMSPKWERGEAIYDISYFNPTNH